MKLDWIGEIWYDYDQIINRPPTMILLLSTPCVIISGISDDTATHDAAAAFADDNPGLSLNSLVYLWVGKTNRGSLFLQITLRMSVAIELGPHLRALGANQKHTFLDNPNMESVRHSTACQLAHYQTPNCHDRQPWPEKKRRIWSEKVDNLIATHLEVPFASGRTILSSPATSATVPHASFAASTAPRPCSTLITDDVIQQFAKHTAQIEKLQLVISQYQAAAPAAMAAQIVAHHQQQVLPDLETLRDQNTELAAQNAELAAQQYELAAAVKSNKVEAEVNLNNHFDQLMNYLSRKEIAPRLNSLIPEPDQSLPCQSKEVQHQDSIMSEE